MSLIEELKVRLKTERRLALDVKVVPKSSRNEVVGTLQGNTIKIKIAAPPEKGKANAELCSFLARELGVKQQDVEIVRGHASSNKHVVIGGQ